VFDDHYLSAAQQPGRQNKRPDRVVIDHCAEVPDHVDIGLRETQHLLDVAQPAIRTRDNCDLGRRRLPTVGIVIVGDGCMRRFSLGVPGQPNH
jgi:hypothetical protein